MAKMESINDLKRKQQMWFWFMFLPFGLAVAMTWVGMTTYAVAFWAMTIICLIEENFYAGIIYLYKRDNAMINGEWR